MAGLLIADSNEDMKTGQESGSEGVVIAPVVMRLASHVRSCFQQALDFKQREILPRLLKCQRLKKGEYESEKLMAIRASGGSEMFFNITETKCEAFSAWITEILIPEGERSWGIAPTPIPSLPPGVAQSVIEEVVSRFREQAAMGQVTPEMVASAAESLYDQRLAQLFDEASKRCKRMEKKIEDQLFEGGFYDALSEFIKYLSEFPIAILKGPVIKMKKQVTWVDGPDGRPTSVVTEQPMPTWEAVDPMLFYPAPNARSVNDAFVCELCEYSMAELANFKGVEGYNTAAIDAVLMNPPSPLWVNGDSERAVLDNRDVSVNSGLPGSTVRAVEFWGSVPGKMLVEWGLQVSDETAYHEVCAVLIGDQIIRAVVNPDPLGRRPYYVDSFICRPKNMYGRSIPEKMEDCQNGSNAAHRTLINNMAMASGPQVAVDISALAPGQDWTTIAPWKVWPYNGLKAAARQSAKPLDFFQPDIIADRCMTIGEYFQNQSDERTMIPRYSYGENDVSGAGQTASGLSMLMSSAARSIKRVVRSVSRTTQCPAIERQYTWNLLFLDNTDFAAMKGDAKVQPRGVLAMMVKEQMMMRRSEFLQMTNNPSDLQIMGIEGRAHVLREVAGELGLERDKIVPSEEVLRAKVQQTLNQQAQEGASVPEEENAETNGGNE